MSQRLHVLSMYRQCLRLSGSPFSESVQKYVKSRFRAPCPPQALKTRLKHAQKGIQAASVLSQSLSSRHFDKVLAPFRTLAYSIPASVLLPSILRAAHSAGHPALVDQLFTEWLRNHASTDKRPHFAFSQFVRTWIQLNAFNSLWSAYCQFREVYPPDVLLLGVLVSACRTAGQWNFISPLWADVLRFNLRPDLVTTRNFVSAAVEVGSAELTTQLLQYCREAGFNDEVIRGQLVKAFLKAGDVESAKATSNIGTKTTRLYNTLISSLTRTSGQLNEAWGQYRAMVREGLTPDEYTYASLLSGCATEANLTLGQQLHAAYTASGISSVVVDTALIDMYSKCGSVEQAQQVFDSMARRDLAAFNALITGLCRAGQLSKAMQTYRQMVAERLVPDEYTFASLLSGCANEANLTLGQQLHTAYSAPGFSSITVDTALIDMYSKCGCVEQAQQVLELMPHRSVSAFNALIAGLCRAGRVGKAMQIYHRMSSEKVSPDEITFVLLLTGCASEGNLTLGRQLHAASASITHLPGSNLGGSSQTQVPMILGTALIDMYGKCGAVEEARQVFDRLPPDRVVYSAMIGAYGLNGCVQQALQLFEQLDKVGLQPDAMSYAAILNACSHGGEVDRALQLYQSIIDTDILTPIHTTCMVDVLARAGRLDEAERLANSDPAVANDEVMWTALMAGCRIHVDVARCERVAERLIQMQPKQAPPYIALANIYSSVGMQKEAEQVRARMAAANAEVTQGISQTEINGVVTSFGPADFSHPRGAELRHKCLEIGSALEAAGHQPDVSWASGSGDADAKKRSLCFHSERIAIAWNLLTTPAGHVIRITKNLRVCGDCHEATKSIARLYGREIVVRDRSRWHVFQKDGTCSCRDYF